MQSACRRKHSRACFLSCLVSNMADLMKACHWHRTYRLFCRWSTPRRTEENADHKQDLPSDQGFPEFRLVHEIEGALLIGVLHPLDGVELRGAVDVAQRLEYPAAMLGGRRPGSPSQRLPSPCQGPLARVGRRQHGGLVWTISTSLRPQPRCRAVQTSAFNGRTFSLG
jgi:hypothetical protein